MARIRTIKPEFWSSAQVVECSTNARLLFVGLWNFADDYGVLPAKRIQIKMQVFPGDPFTIDQIGEWLDELISAGLLVKFSNKNEDYLYVTGWAKHQRIDKPSKKYPGPSDEDSATIRGTFDECSETVRPGMEGNGKEGTAGSSATPTNPYPDDFEALWSIYPKRDGSNPKKAAFSAYRTRLKEGVDPEAIRAGVERYAVWCESRGKVGTEIVMQTKRFFGPGKEWENPWPVAFQPVKLPKDTSAHWRARRAVELPEDFTDFDASLAEINDRLRARPDLRGGLE